MSFTSESKEGVFYTLKLLLKKENFVRPTIIFAVFYIFILLQNWPTILLLLLPIITYSLFAFFKIIEVSKEHTIVQGSGILFNPLGNEENIAKRLYFCLLLEMILLFGMGAESLYHPQLIDNDYFLLYLFPIVIIYIFSPYYALYDIGFSAKIEIDLKNEFYETNMKYNSERAGIVAPREEEEVKLISYLRLNEYKNIFLMMKVFLIFNITGWVVFNILGFMNSIPDLLIEIPGSIMFEGSGMNITFFIFICIFSVPILFVGIIYYIYSLTTKFDLDTFNDILSDLTPILRKKVLKTLEFYASQKSKSKKNSQDL